MNGKEWLAQQPASIREVLYIPEGSNYPAIKESAFNCNKPIDPTKPILIWKDHKLQYASKREE